MKHTASKKKKEKKKKKNTQEFIPVIKDTIVSLTLRAKSERCPCLFTLKTLPGISWNKDGKKVFSNNNSSICPT